VALTPVDGSAVLAAHPDTRPAHCRGETHARVHIRWPTQRDLALAQNFGRHIARRISRWAYLILPAARASGVDPYLIAAVLRAESNGDPLIWNLDSDARGLMQVLHASFEPAANIGLGVSMLADLQRQFRSRDLALAGYNAGPGAVQQYDGIPPFHETRDYVVMVDYYRDLYAGARLSRARAASFKAARADWIAFYRKECGLPS
jgi:soluble lytic murein transglycosylase-like protein